VRAGRAALARLAEAAPQAGAGRALVKGVVLLAALLAAGFAARRLGADSLAHPQATAGFAVTLIVGGGLLSASGVPRQAVAFAGGYAFGLWPGALVSLVAQLLGCVIDFWLARRFARAWATRLLRGRLAGVDRFLAARPFAATLTLRLLPVGNNLALNLLAGLSAMRPWPFLAATVLGYLPQTLVFALAGSGVQLAKTVQVGLGAALFLASAALGIILLRSVPAESEP